MNVVFIGMGGDDEGMLACVRQTHDLLFIIYAHAGENTRYFDHFHTSRYTALYIVRTSWIIGEYGSNFVKTMLRLAENHRDLRVVDDQIGSPTFTTDLAPLLCSMIETEKYGIYHATNEGFCSWAELAEAVFRLAGKDVTVRRVSTEEYGAKAIRPKNSRLSKASLDAGGFARLPVWETSLARMMEKEKSNERTE